MRMVGHLGMPSQNIDFCVPIVPCPSSVSLIDHALKLIERSRCVAEFLLETDKLLVGSPCRVMFKFLLCTMFYCQPALQRF